MLPLAAGAAPVDPGAAAPASFLGAAFESLLDGPPPMSQALSCFTLEPPHPSCENRASLTDCNDSRACFEVELVGAEALLVDSLLVGKPLPAAAAQEVLVC